MPMFRASPKGIYIHHSATRDTETISYDAIKRYHTETNRWEDIGYDYLIEDVGGEAMVFSGRGLQYMGAHTVGYNDCIGVCVVGDYDTEKVSGDKTSLLVRLLAALLIVYPHLTVEDIHYHREVANKTCPGLNFPSRDFLRASVLRVLGR